MRPARFYQQQMCPEWKDDTERARMWSSYCCQFTQQLVEYIVANKICRAPVFVCGHGNLGLTTRKGCLQEIFADSTPRIPEIRISKIFVVEIYYFLPKSYICLQACAMSSFLRTMMGFSKGPLHPPEEPPVFDDNDFSMGTELDVHELDSVKMKAEPVQKHSMKHGGRLIRRPDGYGKFSIRL